jgi:hypothetical protein
LGQQSEYLSAYRDIRLALQFGGKYLPIMIITMKIIIRGSKVGK